MNQQLCSLTSSYAGTLIASIILVTFEQSWIKDHVSEALSQDHIKAMIMIQIIQASLVIYLTFVRYKRDKISKCFNTLMPKVHYTISVLLFVINPVLILLAYALMLISGAYTRLFLPHFTLYAVLSCVLLIWFFARGFQTIEQLKIEHGMFLERQIRNL